MINRSYLVDLLLGGLEGTDDGFKLDLSSCQVLLQLSLLLVQSVQVSLGPAQLLLLALQVGLLRVDLTLKAGDLHQRRTETAGL